MTTKNCTCHPGHTCTSVESCAAARRAEFGDVACHEKRIREALAAGPTEGPWSYADNPYGHDAIYGAGGRLIAHVFGDDAQAQQDACLIAACNPAAIRALLADLDAMRGALKRISCAAKATVSNPEWIAAHADAALKGAAHE